MDEAYIRDLGEFAKVIARLAGSGEGSAEKFLALFRNMGPTRQQITETVLEVRADLQMASATELGGKLDLGITVPFAVSVNASYSRRTATDARASAMIRTTLNAVPASEQVMTALLPRAGEPQHTELPSSDRFRSMLAVFEEALPPRGE
jgi:hypothetical protein